MLLLPFEHVVCVCVLLTIEHVLIGNNQILISKYSSQIIVEYAQHVHTRAYLYPLGTSNFMHASVSQNAGLISNSIPPTTTTFTFFHHSKPERGLSNAFPCKSKYAGAHAKVRTTKKVGSTKVLLFLYISVGMLLWPSLFTFGN